jgi:hypothetical protein
MCPIAIEFCVTMCTTAIEFCVTMCPIAIEKEADNQDPVDIKHCALLTLYSTGIRRYC